MPHDTHRESECLQQTKPNKQAPTEAERDDFKEFLLNGPVFDDFEIERSRDTGRHFTFDDS